MIKFFIWLGWRGSDCKECRFNHASHFNHNLCWHPDYYPCDKFKKEQVPREPTQELYDDNTVTVQ